MKKYFFYKKLDPSKEPIGVGKFANSAEALIHFAARKELTIAKFTSLFELGKK